jgi:HEAT repeat protein
MANPAAPFSFDQHHSTYLILASLAGVIVLAGALYLIGFLGWVIGRVGDLLNTIIRAGYRVWARTLSWAGWLSFLVLTGLLLALGQYLIDRGEPAAAVPVALLMAAMGVLSCLAYMTIVAERYEVARGYKAVHNPAKGQRLAADLIRYGDRVGILLLIAATIATITGFALLNHGLYDSFGRGWYKLRTEDSQAPVYLDFLANALINLLRIVDVLDLARSYHYLDVTFVRQSKWPSTMLLLAFKSFFTLVLLQQVFNSLRQGRVLAETISDFWSSYPPIHERARAALPQFGSEAVSPLLASLGKVEVFTKEQRDELPDMLSGIGPAAEPYLIRALVVPHEATRAVAAAALGKMAVREAVPALATMAADPAESVRVSAAEALGLIGAELVAPSQRPVDRPDAPPRRGWLRIRVRRPDGSGRKRLVDYLLFWRLFRKRDARLLDQVLAGLLAGLRDSSPAVRVPAARGAAAAAGPDLVRLLHDDVDDVQAEAAAALGEVGWGDTRAVAALCALLADGATSAVRVAAATALGRLKAEAAVPVLVSLLSDRDQALREAAAAAVAAIGVLGAQSTQHLVEQLNSEDNLVRAQTAEALASLGAVAEEAAPALVQAMADENDQVRAKAVEAIKRIGEAAAPHAVPGLVRLLSDDDNLVRALAAEALGEMGASAGAATPALLRELRHSNAHVRGNAVESLGKLKAEDARADLEAVCRDPESDVRARALSALALLGSPPSATRATVEEALRDPVPEVRIAALEAVGQWHKDWPDPASVIAPLLEDGNDEVAVQAMQILAKFEEVPEAALAPLCRRLADTHDAWVQAAAAAALGQMGPRAAAAGEALAKAAQTGEAVVREAATRALAMIQPEGAVAAFVAGLRDSSDEIRKIASAGLMKARYLTEDALPAVVEALGDPDLQVRANIAQVLSRMPEVPPEAVPSLVANVSLPHDGLRLNSALALRSVATPAARAALRSRLQDLNARVRLVAAMALLPLDPEDVEIEAVLGDALLDESSATRDLALKMLEPYEAAVAAFRAVLDERVAREQTPERKDKLTRIRAALPGSTEPRPAANPIEPVGEVTVVVEEPAAVP